MVFTTVHLLFVAICQSLVTCVIAEYIQQLLFACDC